MIRITISSTRSTWMRGSLRREGHRSLFKLKLCDHALCGYTCKCVLIYVNISWEEESNYLRKDRAHILYSFPHMDLEAMHIIPNSKASSVLSHESSTTFDKNMRYLFIHGEKNLSNKTFFVVLTKYFVVSTKHFVWVTKFYWYSKMFCWHNKRILLAKY